VIHKRQSTERAEAFCGEGFGDVVEPFIVAGGVEHAQGDGGPVPLAAGHQVLRHARRPSQADQEHTRGHWIKRAVRYTIQWGLKHRIPYR